MEYDEQFRKLMTIMYRLRKECPWDRKQSAESLREYILEEAYEAVETIDNAQWDDLKGELGDLLLQIVFQSVIAEEKELFNISDVIDSINRKLIERHPHIFSDVEVNSAEEVADNWENIKLQKEKRESLLQGVPKNLSALLRAQKVQEKVSKVGFDWDKIEDVIAKIDEELQELKDAVKQNNREAIEEETGDFLFSVVNLARKININSENALRKTTNKFISRFQYIEKKLTEKGSDLNRASLEEMDKLWEDAKTKVDNV